jgi:hypothetical protein
LEGKTIGWNDHVDTTALEQEVCEEWYPTYEGDPYEHPNYDKIYEEALRRYVENQVITSESRNEQDR